MYLTNFFLNQYFCTQGLGIWREGDYAYIISKTSKDFYWSGRKLSINYDREQSSKLTAAIEKNILILCIMHWVALEVINTVKCGKTGKRFDSYAIYRLKGTFFCYFFFSIVQMVHCQWIDLSLKLSQIFRLKFFFGSGLAVITMFTLLIHPIIWTW